MRVPICPFYPCINLAKRGETKRKSTLPISANTQTTQAASRPLKRLCPVRCRSQYRYFSGEARLALKTRSHRTSHPAEPLHCTTPRETKESTNASPKLTIRSSHGSKYKLQKRKSGKETWSRTTGRRSTQAALRHCASENSGNPLPRDRQKHRTEVRLSNRMQEIRSCTCATRRAYSDGNAVP